MTFDIALLLAIIAVGLVLFSIERLPADVIALGILLMLIMTGLLPLERAFLGFGSDAFVLILGLLILTAALLRTGVVELTSRAIIRRMGDRPDRLLGIVLLAAGVLSAFISNTAATAFFLPVVIGIARRSNLSSSKLLMPLAFASILSSSVTLVATSTNIVVSGLMVQGGMSPLGMFELTPVGLPILVVGLLYMYFIGRRLIPDRQQPHELFDRRDGQAYFTDVVILPNSPLAGKTLAESGLGSDLDLTVVRIVRNKRRYLAPQADIRLEENDELLVEGSRDDILKIQNVAGIDLKINTELSAPSLQSNDIRLVEAILLPRSPLIGRTLRNVRFRERYGLQVLAIQRRGETVLRKISQEVLQLGDLLLIQGHRTNIAALEDDKTFRIISELSEKGPNLDRASMAIAAFVGSLAIATLNIVSLPVAVLLGVLAVFLTGCITPEEAYREVDWRVLVLIGSMLGVGAALEHTGAAEYLATHIVRIAGGLNPVWLLSAFFTLTMLLTQPMSNQAAAVVVVPIAMATAGQLGLNPRTFAVMIAVGASCSFITPLEPACLMVYGPGNYRFIDFIRVGGLLTVLIYLIAILLVPMIWPLTGS